MLSGKRRLVALGFRNSDQPNPPGLPSPSTSGGTPQTSVIMNVSLITEHEACDHTTGTP